jgi:flagellar biosynthetic protein FliR
VNPIFRDVLDALPAFALAFARIGSMMALFPGRGEAVAPSSAKIGIAACITLLLTPSLPGLDWPDSKRGAAFALMIAAEVVTGLWFGLLVRLLVMALAIAGQVIGYLIGLSSVLQPDAEIGAQTNAVGRLFDLAGPLLMLTFGLYRLPLGALQGLFVLLPLGQMLPSGDSLAIVVEEVGTVFDLALQLASPFVVVSVIWQVAMGQVARVVARMQIYFISMPGQILAGLAVLAFTAEAMTAVWRHKAEALMLVLPGGR